MDEFLNGSGLSVDMLLCEAAQLAAGKLYILGGGVAFVGPAPRPLAIAMQITVPWNQANVQYKWRIDLLDEDGHPVVAKSKPVAVQGTFEAHRPPGLRPGSPLGVSLVINLSPLPLPGGKSYTFALAIDDEHQPNWRLRFFMKPRPS